MARQWSVFAMRTIAGEFGPVAHLIIDTVLRVSGGTRRSLAQHLGVSESQITRWASGDRPLPVELLPHLARYARSPEAALGELAARCGVGLVPMEPVVPVVESVRALRRAGTAVAHAIDEALVDGVISRAEESEIDSLVAQLEAQARRWRSRPRGGGR
jgi:transcriptional regulator with XRE-family HTH domain